MAVVRQSQNFPCSRPPSRGRRTAKIQSAGDGHSLHLQTHYPVWWRSMHAISSYRGNRPPPPVCHKYTDRTDYNTLCR